MQHSAQHTISSRWRLVGVLGRVASVQIVHQNARYNEQQPKRMAFCVLRKQNVDRRCRGQRFSGPKKNRPADGRRPLPRARRLMIDAKNKMRDSMHRNSAGVHGGAVFEATSTKIICPNMSAQFHPSEHYRASVIRNARREHRPKANASAQSRARMQ